MVPSGVSVDFGVFLSGGHIPKCLVPVDDVEGGWDVGVALVEEEGVGEVVVAAELVSKANSSQNRTKPETLPDLPPPDGVNTSRNHSPSHPGILILPAQHDLAQLHPSHPPSSTGCEGDGKEGKPGQLGLTVSDTP